MRSRFILLLFFENIFLMISPGVLSSCWFLVLVTQVGAFHSPWGVIPTTTTSSSAKWNNIDMNKKSYRRNNNNDCRQNFDLMATKQEPELRRVESDEEGIPIPFIDAQGTSFIECYADSVATVSGVEYTIGVPCDYSVALCYFDESNQLLPIELDDELMDEIFPIAESIVDEEYGDELVLQRTPQTLTLVGELEDDDDDEESEQDFLLSEDDENMSEDDEEVEVLLSFEHNGVQYNLVRLLDPVLLVGKHDPENESDSRLLLTADESEQVMPILERMFLEYNLDRDDLLP